MRDLRGQKYVGLRDQIGASNLKSQIATSRSPFQGTDFFGWLIPGWRAECALTPAPHEGYLREEPASGLPYFEPSA